MRTETLCALIDACIDANAVWFEAERSKARRLIASGVSVQMPPCCLGCVEPRVRYEMPAKNQRCQNWYLAPDVLRRGLASCLDAALFEAGSARAKGKDASVILVPQTIEGDDPHAVVDFHAVALIDGVEIDSSTKLATPTKAARCACD